jgi:hypothetical protein
MLWSGRNCAIALFPFVYWIHLPVALALPPATQTPSLVSSTTNSAEPPAEVPEEILRTEIILEARSPIDGKPISAADYAKLQAEEQASYQPPPEVAPKVRSLVRALRLRKFIKKYLPIIPIR